jgi:hypothetical protein
VNYLVATGKPVGLILSFGEQKVEVKRKVKDLNAEKDYNGKRNPNYPVLSCNPV